MIERKTGGHILVAGSANVDFVVRAPYIAAPGETVLGGDLATFPGGKGANQAVACARAGGAATRLLAAMGNDPLSATLENSVRAAGVDLIRIASDRPTGAALITVSDEAENAITVAPGANMTLLPEHLPDLTDVSWLVMQLETPLATVTAMAKTARAAGTSVLLNAAPAQPLGVDLLAQVDILVVNEAELYAIAGAGGTLCDRLVRLGVPLAVVTLGARGCCAFDGRGFVFQPSFDVSSVDTTGAGDTFTGVFAAALAGGGALPDALRHAAAAAALATTRAGAQDSIPTRSEVEAFVASGRTRSAEDLATYCRSRHEGAQ